MESENSAQPGPVTGVKFQRQSGEQIKLGGRMIANLMTETGPLRNATPRHVGGGREVEPMILFHSDRGQGHHVLVPCHNGILTLVLRLQKTSIYRVWCTVYGSRSLPAGRYRTQRFSLNVQRRPALSR